MDFIKNIANLLPPEAWATYITGGVAAYFITRQVRYSQKLGKKDVVFQEISQKIEDARNKFDQLDSDKKILVDELARIANYYSSQPINQPVSQEDFNKSIEEINKLYDTKIKHISSLYATPKAIIKIIGDIEKSTLLNKKSKQMARILYHAYDEQFKLMETVNDGLSTFNVIPPPGGSINVTSETFNNFIALVNLTYNKNNDFRNYLDDLEVAIHNSLVKNIFGKARTSSMIEKHLTKDGFEDLRKIKSLI